MTKLWKLLKEHFKEDFHSYHYLSQLIFLAVALLINFIFGIENNYIDAAVSSPLRIVWYFLIYASGFYSSCWMISYFRGIKSFWRSKKFITLSLSGLIILSIERGFPFTHSIIREISDDYQVYLWFHQVMGHVLSFFISLIPLAFVYFSIDKQPSRFYGLFQSSDIRPYIGLLVIMIPLIGFASLNESFTNYYPTYKHTSIDVVYGWPKWLPSIFYELVYGISFLNVEIIFRGFFVIGMSQVLGKQSILPMVSIYCLLHFGKPEGEAISSIIGGYILGVLALYTRTLWGGVFVHVGVAWMMEAAAYFVKHSANA